MIAPATPPAASLRVNDRQYSRPSAKKSAANIHNFGKKRSQSGNKKAFSAMYETIRKIFSLGPACCSNRTTGNNNRMNVYGAVFDESSRIAIVNQAKPRRQESLLSDARPNNVHARMSSAVNGRKKKKRAVHSKAGAD